MTPLARLVLFAVLAAPALSACGFTPLHATAPGAASFNDVSVSVSDGSDENDRAAGFLLRQHLTDRIGSDATGRFTLSITPRVRQVGLGLTGQDRASRFDSVLDGTWELRQRSDGKLVARGRETSTATFSADADPYRRLTTNEAAVDRVSREVADEILTAVALAIADAPSSTP